VVIGRVGLSAGHTPYAAVGDVLGWLFLAVSCAAGVAALLGGRRLGRRPIPAPRRT
jgi:hypothetical protein